MTFGLDTGSEIRMALGQLLAYRRWVKPAPAFAVLLAQRPRRDP